MKRQVGFLIALTMLVMALGGCKGTTATPTVVPSSSSQAAVDYSETGTLNLDWFAGNGTDSVFECTWVDQQCLYHPMVFDSLIKLKADVMTMVPALAKSWTISADAKTYTFTINEAAKWHDGTAFTVADVLFTYNTILKVPESGLKSRLTAIVGAQDVLDKKADTVSGIVASGNKVTFTLKVADSSIATAFATINILPSHLLKTVDPILLAKNEAFWKKPIGTGAYYINEVSYPNFVSLLRNDNYFGPKANIKKVLLTSHMTGGEESIKADVIAGKLDYVFGNAINDITKAQNIVKQNPEIKMTLIPATYQRYLMFNNVGSTDAKYNNSVQKAEVRQAFNLLLDKDALAGFYKGQAVPLTTFVNPKLPAYNSDIPLFKRDVKKAKEMLTAAGFDFTKTVRLLYYYNDQTTADFIAVIKQNFTDAGVLLEPFLASGDLGAIIYKTKNWDILYGATSAEDPIMIYKQLVPDKGNRDGLFGDIENRQAIYGTLLEKYNSITDPVEKKKIGNQIQLEAAKYSMMMPVYGLNKVVLYNQTKLKLEASILDADLQGVSDLHFDKWELLK